jgi:hypothetical protein
MIEVFGYISMIVVLISTMMKDMKKLRIINSIGCLMFVIYGLYMQTYPIVAMNIVVILIHFWRLYKGES